MPAASRENRLLAWIWMPVVALLWAICFPFITIGLPHAPPLFFAALRALLSGLLLALVAILQSRRHGLRLRRRDWPALAAIGLTFTAMGFGGMFLGAGRLSPGLATVLASTQPLLAALMAAAWLDEPLTRCALLGFTVGFAGVTLLSLGGTDGGDNGYIAGVAWVLVAAIGTAAGNVLLKRCAQGAVLLPMAVQLVIGSGLLLLASAIAEEPWSVHWTLGFSGSLLVLSALATALMVVLWYWLLAKMPLGRLNVFSFLTPAFGLAIGYLYFGERLDTGQAAGIAVILLGIVILQFEDR